MTTISEPTTALAAAAETAPTNLALVVLDPARYVAEVYAPFGAKLASAIAAADSLPPFDITTPAGYKVALGQRAVFRDDIRLALEKCRKDTKAPILIVTNEIDGKAKEITAAAAPYEKRFDDAIKAEDARKERIKAEEAERERQRIAAIQAKIDDIRSLPLEHANTDSVQIGCEIAGLEALEITLDEYGELTGQAVAAKTATLVKLQEMQAAAGAREAEARRQEEELAERERLAEIERQAMEAERKRLAELQAKIDEQARIDAEAAAKAKREADEAARLEREKLAAERREFERQQAEEQERIEAQNAEMLRMQAEERAKLEAAFKAEQERVAKEMADQRAELDRQAAELQRKQDEADARARAELEAKAAAAVPAILPAQVQTAELVIDQKPAIGQLQETGDDSVRVHLVFTARSLVNFEGLMTRAEWAELCRQLRLASDQGGWAKENLAAGVFHRLGLSWTDAELDDEEIELAEELSEAAGEEVPA